MPCNLLMNLLPISLSLRKPPHIAYISNNLLVGEYDVRLRQINVYLLNYRSSINELLIVNAILRVYFASHSIPIEDLTSHRRTGDGSGGVTWLLGSKIVSVYRYVFSNLIRFSSYSALQKLL